jgi:hypothetical protein
MWQVMTACVIMHNMIVKEEHDDSVYDQGWDFQGELVYLRPWCFERYQVPIYLVGESSEFSTYRFSMLLQLFSQVLVKG